ncbi:MAG: xanthine dehydrogenase family protein molybdopterin-binding subunit [Pseudonocardia sp.]|uniref:aerobic carbon-monoxide dehydrogenase large subunit n=3 Tax=unclassified Pseudonocardia TaxID=2619320 RepID=UPI00086C8685|nr:aerobic carbon-monoxide dehydrogenase large subunit [Pseudonocardia sp.]MBN9113298.1 xanthine dehydrogenase family protein molybdopterin-binding subunit [Pseudonocardia sp.]ODU26561.1 MAG: xanthine dehydrogenase [Pseudonocardia sp. SCN 72-51]
MSTRQFGARVQRNEDARLVTGRGRFVDDLPLDGVLHGAFARSAVARGRITHLDTTAARALPGVHRVYTHADLGELDVTMPLLIPHPCIGHPRTQYPLAHEDVYHVGQAIAFVVADDRYIAEDAARLIEIDYDILPVEVDPAKAALDGAPLVHEDVPNNIAAHLVQVSGDPEAAFAAADHVTRIQVRVDRSTAAPMECLSTAARWDAVSGELTVWDGTQAPIGLRGALASLFELDEDKVRVVAPDVGGGFGPKIVFPYSNEILVPFAAKDLRRPVKWVEDRSENFVHMTHERTQIHDIELAATSDGVVLGLRDTFLHDTGSFIPYGIAVAQVASTQIAGPYRIPAIHVTFDCVYTPTVPVTPYRGCGRPQANFAIERAMDQLAAELGIDRFEIRRRNFIAPDEFPYTRPDLLFADGLPVTLDSGRYDDALAALEKALDLDAISAEQEQARGEGRLLGLGLSFYVEGTGLGPYEGAKIRLHPITGKAYVNTGLTAQGQGHETAWAQIVADQIGVRPEDVIVVEGDTGVFDWGVATFASRAAVVSGNAVHVAAVSARARIAQAAANMLEADPDDIELEDGRAFVRGTSSRGVTLAEVATMSNPLRYAFNKAAQTATQFAPTARSTGKPLPDGERPGIEVSEYYSPPHATWAYGVHAALVEVDPVTCDIDVKRYVCVHDCGNMINPMIVEGQVAGGVAQGMGGAFYEKLEYDENGVLRNASFMDFLVPYATEIPHIEMVHMETPSPLNPLGVKGVGEAGTIPVGQVIASAVEDALSPLGTPPVRQVPLSPSAIHDLLREARVSV